MRVFRYVVHQYADDHFVDALYDLLSGVRRDQMMDALYDLLLDDQKFYVLGGQLLDVLHDQYVVLMCVTYR
jgi:hypothetical protein